MRYYTKMNHDLQPLITYIEEHRRQGFSDEQIKQSVIAAGWPPEYVDMAFTQVADSSRVGSGAAASPVSTPESPTESGVIPGMDHPAKQNTLPIDAPQKYRVFRAVADVFRAIRHNWLAFVCTTILSYVLLILLTIASLPIAYVIIRSMGGFGLIVFILLFSAIGAYGASLVLSVQAQSLYDGNNRHRRAVMETLRVAIRHLPRVALACLLVGAAIYGPLIGVSILTILLTLSGSVNSGFSILPLLLSLVAMVWILVGLLRYSLAPMVAFFERDVPIMKTLGRSSHLLQGGGQWFIVKGVALLILLVIIISASAGIENQQQLQDSDNIFVNIALIILMIVANGAMVMLYDNRRRVKDGTTAISRS